MMGPNKEDQESNGARPSAEEGPEQEDTGDRSIFDDRQHLQMMSWDIGRLLQLIGLGPLAWAGAAAGLTIPSLQGLLWAGVLLPAITSLIGFAIEKGVEYSQGV